MNQLKIIYRSVGCFSITAFNRDDEPIGKSIGDINQGLMPTFGMHSNGRITMTITWRD